MMKLFKTTTMPMDLAIIHYRKQRINFKASKENEEVDRILDNGNIRQDVLMADERAENNITVKIPVSEYSLKRIEEIIYGSRIKKLMHRRKFKILQEVNQFRLCWNQKGEELNPPITY